MYDAIVVGARCAGSPTAMLLARKGYRVLLVDRAAFPSDTISTHIIWQPGVAQLERWGLRETLAASGCPPITSLTLDLGEFALAGAPPPADGVAEAYGPRRTVLDKLLIDAAVEAGVELRERSQVRELLWDDGRVVGIHASAGGGATVTERGRIVIGADGMRSVVAHSVRAPEYETLPTLAGWYYSYWSGLPCAGIELYARDGRAIGAIPTHDGLVCVTMALRPDDVPEFRADLESGFWRTLQLAPGLAERARGGRRVERFAGTSDLPNFFRKRYGPGWALVGDAGYHKDPATAQGITDAFHDADRLAEAIDDGFSGRRSLDEALADYERERNTAVMPMYQFTAEFASLDPPPPELQALFAALRGNQEETDRFFGTIAGTVPIPEFFAPENVERITGAVPA
jgi:flavin-dependent dehydrogenase